MDGYMDMWGCLQWNLIKLWLGQTPVGSQLSERFMPLGKAEHRKDKTPKRSHSWAPWKKSQCSSLQPASSLQFPTMAWEAVTMQNLALISLSAPILDPCCCFQCLPDNTQLSKVAQLLYKSQVQLCWLQVRPNGSSKSGNSLQPACKRNPTSPAFGGLKSVGGNYCYF